MEDQEEKKKTAHPEAPESEPSETTADEAAAQPADATGSEVETLKDRLLRLQADFDNFRKRTVRDREEQTRRACERIIKDLLPVVDHFEIGLQSARKHHAKHAVIEGFEGILTQLRHVLERAGVSALDTVGKAFDPKVHECVAHVPSEEQVENTVIQETRRGYKLGSYVLRAPQVIVSTGPAGSVPAPEEADPPVSTPER